MNSYTQRKRFARAIQWRTLAAALLIVAGLSDQSPMEYEAQASQRVTASSLTSQYTLSYSTYMGASAFDQPRDIAVDSQGNIYIAGGTESSTFPTTPGAYDTSHNGYVDVFVMKLDPNGGLIWSTFVGGPNYDRAYAIEVDSQGYVYVAGRAGDQFPVTSGAFQPDFMAGGTRPPYFAQDGFVFKLSPDGANLEFASYFGTADQYIVRDVAIDQNGDIYLASSRDAGGAVPPGWDSWFAGGYQSNMAGGIDGVVAKVASNGSAVRWATYVGGAGDEGTIPSIRVNNDAVYFLTGTSSSDMPTTAGAYDRTYGGKGDLHLAKLSLDGTQLQFGTFIGGSELEDGETHNLALDMLGNAYVAAGTSSSDFPTTPGAFQRIFGSSASGPDAFVAKISANGQQLLASTYLGGSAIDYPEGIVVDGEGNVYFAGSTGSTDFPVTADAFQIMFAGKVDAYAVKLSADLGQLLYSTYLGGRLEDRGRSSIIDGHGNFYVVSDTRSDDWPLLNPPFPQIYQGNEDAAVIKLALATPINHSPNTPTSPVPVDGATNVPISQILGWQAGDLDGDIVSYTVALGPTNPPPTAGITQQPSFTPFLAPDTRYYWRITATDGISSTIGPLWQFMTAAPQMTPPANVTISGPATGSPNTAYSFTAQVTPDSVALPVSYTWQADDRPPVIQSGSLSNTIALQWQTTGVHTLTVTATNSAGVVANTHLFTVVPEQGLLQFAASTYSISEEGASAVITVERIGGVGHEVQVAYASSDGTATAGADYQPVSGTLTFSPGVLSQDISVAIIDDNLDEPDESIQIALSNPTTGTILGASSDTLLTVLDEDLSPVEGSPRPLQTGLFSFVDSTGNVEESAAATTVVVQRTQGTDGQTGVSYLSANGTAIADLDYSLVSGNLIFAQDVQSQTFQIPIVDDDLVEGNETLTLVLNNPTGGAGLGSPSTIVLTILDNDDEDSPGALLPNIRK